MKRAYVYVLLGILLSSPSWAIDESNQPNVDTLKTMLFAEDAKAGAGLVQKGVTTDTKTDCTLTMHLTRFGLELVLHADKKFAKFGSVLPST